MIETGQPQEETISTQLELRAGATYCDYSTAYSTDIRALGSLPFPVLDHGFFPGGLAPITNTLARTVLSELF